jgi:hypothetical protein
MTLLKGGTVSSATLGDPGMASPVVLLTFLDVAGEEVEVHSRPGLLRCRGKARQVVGEHTQLLLGPIAPWALGHSRSRVYIGTAAKPLTIATATSPFHGLPLALSIFLFLILITIPATLEP